MALLAVPPLELPGKRWPTLGNQVADWIEANLVYGPGPLSGQPYECEPEFRAELCRAYEVFPKGHPREGRRRFGRVYLSKRKGAAKSEKGALVVIAEAHPDGPVRFDGWDAHGEPVGRSVRDPYIPMLAFTEEQSEDLAYSVVRQVIEGSEVAGDFDVGLDRVIVLGDRGQEAGKIAPLANSPNARDGARTSMQHFDEPHRMNSPRHRAAHATMVENSLKRYDADAWTLYTSTAGDLNEHTVARDVHLYAEQIDRGEVTDAVLCYLHRFAPNDMPTDTPENLRELLLEAAGPAASWSSDIDRLVARFFEPDCDREYYLRVWANQWRQGRGRAFNAARISDLARPDHRVEPGAFITLGFDGARSDDATALIATEIESGFQWPVKVWTPADGEEIDHSDVDATVRLTFEQFDVARLYCDPPHWGEWVDKWAGEFGSSRVVKWWTTRKKAMAWALHAYHQAMSDGTWTHSNDGVFVEHLTNPIKDELAMVVDDDGEPLWLIKKPRQQDKIDAAMAGCLSWEARRDAIAAGAKPQKQNRPAKYRARSF